MRQKYFCFITIRDTYENRKYFDSSFIRSTESVLQTLQPYILVELKIENILIPRLYAVQSLYYRPYILVELFHRKLSKFVGKFSLVYLINLFVLSYRGTFKENYYHNSLFISNIPYIYTVY